MSEIFFNSIRITIVKQNLCLRNCLPIIVTFINSDASDKVDDMLLWFRGLVWTLEDAVYDMTMDDFDFQVPSIEFESIE